MEAYYQLFGPSCNYFLYGGRGWWLLVLNSSKIYALRSGFNLITVIYKKGSCMTTDKYVFLLIFKNSGYMVRKAKISMELVFHLHANSSPWKLKLITTSNSEEFVFIC